MSHSPVRIHDSSISSISVPSPPPPPPPRPASGTSLSTLATTSSKTLPQYWAALTCSGGGFALGTVMGWAAPASGMWYSRGLSYETSVARRTAEVELNCNSGGNETRSFSPHSIFTHNPHDLTENQFSWAVTVFAIGAALSAIPAGIMLKHLGRKITVFIFLIPLVIGWMVVMFSRDFLTLLVGRLLLGISAGTSTMVVPIYIGEIAVPEIRGRAGAIYQTMVNSGILFMFAVGPFVTLPTLIFISAVVTLCFYVFYYFAPESPTFLVSNNFCGLWSGRIIVLTFEQVIVS